MYLPQFIIAALVARQSVVVLPSSYCSPDCRKFYLILPYVSCKDQDSVGVEQD